MANTHIPLVQIGFGNDSIEGIQYRDVQCQTKYSCSTTERITERTVVYLGPKLFTAGFA